MRLLALAGDIGATIAQIRLGEPLRALAEQRGWSLTLKSFFECTSADLAAADVLVVQRADSRLALRLQQRMRQMGGAVVYDIDDLLTDVPSHIGNQASVRARALLRSRCMSACDAVSVSTVRLGIELALPQAMLVPNHAPAGDYLSLPPEDESQPVHLIFASSDRLATGFIYPALRGLPGIKIVVVGPPAADFAKEGFEVRAEPLRPRAAFIDLVRHLPNPLAAIPLESSRFASCKSAVKWFDYATVGVPTLCSAVSPYSDVIQDGITGGLVANDVGSWRAALQRATTDRAWRHRIAIAARAEVRQRHAQQHTVDAWALVVTTAIARRRQAGPPSDGAFRWLTNAALQVADQTVARLRVFNRARLARRHAARR